MFVCAVSIIYKVVFVLISTGTPTEENHDIFSISFFFFTDTDFSQGSKRKQGIILFSSLYHFHEHSDIYFQLCIMFTHKHLCVLGKQKHTMAVWYNVYITKKLLLVLTEAKKGVPGKHCSSNLCFFSFPIFPSKSNPSRNIGVRYSILI